MSNPIITYVEFDDSQVKGQPVKNLYYAEWTPLNDDDSGSGYGDPKDDEEPIPDDTRKNGSRVCLFDDAEDAMIEAMRAEGNTCSRIAAACFVWFGRKRSAATVGVRLRMLANRKEAAE